MTLVPDPPDLILLDDEARPPWPVSTPRTALDAVPWLAAVPSAAKDRLCGQAMLHRLPAGSLLFEQAEVPAFAQLLVAGGVALLAVRAGEEALVELVRAPDLLLPAAVLNRQPYLLRARALDEVQLVLIESKLFQAEVVADRALCLAVLACQAAQFRRQVKLAKNVRLRSAEERVGSYVLRLIEAAAPGAAVRLPMEKRLIAAELGMTRETLSRAMAGLTGHGLRVQGDRVLAEDLAAARARFPLDPLIDAPEAIVPLGVAKG